MPWPDLLLDGQAVFTADGRFYWMADALATYRLDFVTRLIAGVGVILRSPDATEQEWDWIVGLEFRLGHLRVRQAARRIGVLNRTGYEARVSYVF